MAEPHLRAVQSVDDRTGELETVASLKAEIKRRDAIVKGLERDINGWRVRYRQLADDKAVEAREHPLWPLARRIFDGWRRMCSHPGSHWTPDRFWMIEEFLSLPKYGATLEVRVAACCRVIAGARHDCFSVRRKNGTVRRFDEWDRLFGSVGKYEEFMAKAPVGWVPTLSDPMRDLIVDCAAKLREAKAVRSA